MSVNDRLGTDEQKERRPNLYTMTHLLISKSRRSTATSLPLLTLRFILVDMIDETVYLTDYKARLR